MPDHDENITELEARWRNLLTVGYWVWYRRSEIR